jgi:hypothetical protein
MTVALPYFDRRGRVSGAVMRRCPRAPTDRRILVSTAHSLMPQILTPWSHEQFM